MFRDIFNQGITQPQMSGWEQLAQDADFQELLRLQRLAAASTKDPSLGSVNQYLDVIEQLRDQIIDRVGLRDQEGGVEAFNQFVREQVGGDEESVLAKPLENVLRFGSGLLETVALPGDIIRTLTANLADVQGERVAREIDAVSAALSQGGVLNPSDFTIPVPEGRVDPRTGKFRGEPPRNAVQALGEVTEAAVRTAGDLGFNKAPVSLTGQWPFVEANPESGFITYLPSLIWNSERVWGADPFQNSGRVTGEQINDRFGISERVCGDNQQCRAWLGIGTEVVMDPLLWSDTLFLGAKVTRALASGIGRLTGTRGSAPVTGLIDWTYEAERAARNVYTQVSPVGVAQNLGATIDLLPFSPMTRMAQLITRGINGVLDLPVSETWLPKSVREARGTLGFNPRDPGGSTSALPSTNVVGASMQPRLRDLLFQGGRVTGVENPRRWDWLSGSPETGLSAGEIAIAKEDTLRRVAARGALEVHTALTDGLTQTQWFRLPWIRAAIPDSRIVQPEFQPYVNGLHAITSDIVDTTGTMAPWRTNPEIMDRIKTLAVLHNQPLDQTLRRIRGAVSASRRVILQTGFHVSGYQEFVNSMRTVSQQMIDSGQLPPGVTVNEVRRAYELMRANLDVQGFEARGIISMAGPNITGAEPSAASSAANVRAIQQFWQANPNELALWEQNIQSNLAARGREDLSGITPWQYLDGIANGYLRREFEGVNNPMRVLESLSNRSMVVMRNINPGVITRDFDAAFGAGAGAVVNDLIKTMLPPVPRGMTAREAGRPAISLRTDHIAELLSQRLGRNVTIDEVANVVYGRNSNASFLARTLELLRQNARAGSRSASGAPWAMTPAPFEPREQFTFKDLAQLAMVRDPAALTAMTGARAGRQLRAQDVLARAFDELNDAGLLVNPASIGVHTGPRNANLIFPFQGPQGERYVVLPDNANVWGPLANQGVPEDLARLLAYSLTVNRSDSTLFQRIMGMWRTGMISGLPQALRNIYGDYKLAADAGADITELIINTPRAHRINREFARTGRLPEEFQGYEYLFNWVTESALINSIDQSLDSLLTQMMTNRTALSAPGAGTGERVVDNAEAFIRWMSTNPIMGTLTLGGTGFIPLFRWGSETVRTSNFLTIYDEMIRAGLSRDEAVQRAAHWAINSNFNYGASPLMVDFMRRNGLSAFPQFAWFNISRRFRTLGENPASLSRLEYLRRGVNVGTSEGDIEEEERLTALMADWQRFSHPMALPMQGEDGSYRVLNLEYWVPGYSDMTDLVFDPFTLPAFSPMLDAFSAWMSGTGRGAVDPRFPSRVFNPAMPTGTRVGETLSFLGRQYVLPNVWRVSDRAQQVVEHNEDPELFQLLAELQGRYYNSQWDEFGGSLLGLTAREVSVLAGSPSFNARMREINNNAEVQLRALQGDLLEAQLAAQRNPSRENLDRLEFLRQREQTILKGVREETMQLTRMIRGRRE